MKDASGGVGVGEGEGVEDGAGGMDIMKVQRMGWKAEGRFR
jgi:hypothetical protein